MRIEFYSPNLERKAISYTWVSLLWRPEYYGVGLFLVEFQRDAELFGLLSEMDYAKLDEDDNLMIVTTIQIKDNKLVVGGFSANWIFTQRVSEKVISNKNAEQSMRELVAEMSPWDNLSLGESAGLSDVFSAQISDYSLSNYFKIIGEATDVGYRVRKDRKSLLFECYKPGLNTDYKFSATLGNMKKEKYISSENEYKNVAIVAGGGEGTERVSVTVGETSATGKDRREVYIDARAIQPEEGESDESYRNRLALHGKKELATQNRIKNTEFEIQEESLKLGDLVSVVSSYTGETYTARITSYTIKSQNNKVTKTVSIGSPVIRI